MHELSIPKVGFSFSALAIALLAGRMVTASESWAFLVPILILAVLVLVQPFWGLLFFAVLIPLESSFLSLGGGAASVTRFLGIYLLGVWLIQVVVKRYKILVPGDIKLALVFVFWGSASILWSFSQSVTLSRIQTAAQLVMLVVLVVNLIIDQQRLKSLLVALFLGCFIATLLGLTGIGVETDSRLLTLQDQGAKEYGSYVGIMFLIGTILLLFTAGKNRLIGFAAILFSAIPLIRVNERGVFFAIGVAWLAIAFITRQKPRTMLVIAILSAVMYYLPSVLVQKDIISDYHAERLTIENILDTGGSGRTEIWGVGKRMFVNNPLFGTGWGNFPVVYDHYASPMEIVTSRTSGKDPHGDLMGVAGELGIIGILLFLVLYFRILFRNMSIFRRYKELEHNILAILVVALLAYIFSMGFTSTFLWRKVYWLILGMGILFPVLYGSSRERNTNPKTITEILSGKDRVI